VAEPAALGEGARIIGRNYVIVQSYPDEKSANDAKEILINNGVSCTVEKGLPGWGLNTWFSVVGKTGFDRIHSTQFEDYIKNIETTSAKFAGTSKFKRFEPHPYKWKDSR